MIRSLWYKNSKRAKWHLYSREVLACGRVEIMPVCHAVWAPAEAVQLEGRSWNDLDGDVCQVCRNKRWAR